MEEKNELKADIDDPGTTSEAPQESGETQESREQTAVMPALAASPGADGNEDAEGDRGRTRLKRSLLTPSRSQAVVGVLLAAVGFTAVIQVRSNELDNTYEGRRQEDLIQIFNGLTGTSDRTRREIERLEQSRRDLQVDTSAREAAVEQAEQRLATLRVLAGLVPVTGPGLRITVTEGDGRVSPASLLDMVQELRTAGAEAMEFNDSVRLVASSHFDLVDGVIELDGVRLRAPYVLEVIGDPYTLRTGVVFPSGPVAYMRDKEGATVDIEELDRVDVTSVVEAPRPEFAEPAEGQ